MSRPDRPVRAAPSGWDRTLLARTIGTAAAWRLRVEGGRIGTAKGIAAGRRGLLALDRLCRHARSDRVASSDFGVGRRLGRNAPAAFGCRTRGANQAAWAGPPGSDRTLLTTRIGIMHSPVGHDVHRLCRPHWRVRLSRSAGSSPGAGRGPGRTGATLVGCRTSGVGGATRATPNHPGREERADRSLAPRNATPSEWRAPRRHPPFRIGCVGAPGASGTRAVVQAVAALLDELALRPAAAARAARAGSPGWIHQSRQAGACGRAGPGI
jgi:hypothetical protein